MTEAKQIITDSKNVYLITSQEPEALACTLALFYTLKELGKNVNLLTEKLPDRLNFLAPSLDFISYPKNFVISVPNSVAQISQIYYEKNNDALKLHLTLEKGDIKKDNVAFYFQEKQPDLIICIGVKDYYKELSEKLNSFAFLMNSPILNIDNSKDNKNFGKINIIEEKSLAEIILEVSENSGKEYSKCLLTSLVIYTDNFKKNLTANIFKLTSDLMNNEADLKEIVNNVYKLP
jgi:nanoRNase/pAp phosphatase (c-di-AMP/oligoRNAs hydrolase)